MAKNKAKTGLTYAINRSYKYDSAPDNALAGISEADWKKDVEATIDAACGTGLVLFMAHIYHDKDQHKDKETKKMVDTELHCHILVRFKKIVSSEKIQEMFKVLDNGKGNCSPVDSAVGASRYLTHISDDALEKEKHIYSFDEVKCWGCAYTRLVKGSFWKELDGDDATMLMKPDAAEKLFNNLAQKVYNGELRRNEAIDELQKKAGYYYRRKYRNTLFDDQHDYIMRRVAEMTKNGRNNQNIYIMGSGGIGKTTLARKLGADLADGKGLYSSDPLGKDKTPDALNHYTDEAVAIFNEISPRGWSLEEYLDCFDMHSYSGFPARGENKPFIGHTSIFTNSISPLRFAKDLLIYQKGGSNYQDSANKHEINQRSKEALDKYWQARRRLKHVVILVRDTVDPETVHVHVFNLRIGMKRANGTIDGNNGVHMKVGQTSFITKRGEEPIITDDTIAELIELFNVDVQNKFDDVELLSEFLEKNDLLEIATDDMIDEFIATVVNECVWDLLPFTFLYDLYKSYKGKYFATHNLLTLREFGHHMEVALNDGWERTNNPVSSNGRMDLDEPLITEYNLTDWNDKSYRGNDLHKLRDFPRKSKYRGFLRR